MRAPQIQTTSQGLEQGPLCRGQPRTTPGGWQNGAGSLTSVPGPPKVRSTSGQGFLSFLGEGKTHAVSSPCVPDPQGCPRTCLPYASPAPGIINGDSLGLQNKMFETQNELCQSLHKSKCAHRPVPTEIQTGLICAFPHMSLRHD